MSWLAQLFRRHRRRPAPTPEPRLVVLPPYSFQRQHAAPPLPPPRPRRMALGTHGDAGPPPPPRPVAARPPLPRPVAACPPRTAPPPVPAAPLYSDDENTIVTVRPGVDMGELYPEGDTRG